nr:hypothetical protein [Tanacetum cinerariifolium]
MQQLANMLSGFQKQFPPTNNQLRASSNPRSQATGKRENQANGSNIVCYNCRGEGHVARQCKEPKRARNSQWYADKALLLNAQEKGEVLDAEAEAFLADVECTAPYEGQLAMTTTNMFQANHEDAYDSDVDDEPDASIAFMANFSSAGSPSSSNNISINEAKSSVSTTKTIRKPNVVTPKKPMWKPIGRHFTLYASSPLTRILEPIDEPVELTPSVSSNANLTIESSSSSLAVIQQLHFI